MKFTYLTLLFLFVLSFSACDDDEVIDTITGEEPVDVTGLTYVEDEENSLTDIYDDILGDLNAAGPITVAAEVNHQANASSVGLTLRPTRVIMFGNPTLGTPLMQQNMAAGLDLPQKILLYQASDDDVIVAYNSTRYLASRHDLTDNGELTMIGNALQMFVENNTGEEVSNSAVVEVEAGEGIITNITNSPVDSVYNRIKQAIQDRNLGIALELDHAANAASVGLSLDPSRLIIFGNPMVGTPLMQEDQSIGIDLPQNILVYQNENGSTSIIYNDPTYIADRHDIDEDLEQNTTIASVLAEIVAEGLGN